MGRRSGRQREEVGQWERLAMPCGTWAWVEGLLRPHPAAQPPQLARHGGGSPVRGPLWARVAWAGKGARVAVHTTPGAPPLRVLSVGVAWEGFQEAPGPTVCVGRFTRSHTSSVLSTSGYRNNLIFVFFF